MKSNITEKEVKVLEILMEIDDLKVKERLSETAAQQNTYVNQIAAKNEEIQKLITEIKSRKNQTING